MSCITKAWGRAAARAQGLWWDHLSPVLAYAFAWPPACLLFLPSSWHSTSTYPPCHMHSPVSLQKGMQVAQAMFWATTAVTLPSHMLLGATGKRTCRRAHKWKKDSEADRWVKRKEGAQRWSVYYSTLGIPVPSWEWRIPWFFALSPKSAHWLAVGKPTPEYAPNIM